MGPAELLDYDRIAGCKGLVLEEGSPTAHVAIVARAFDIPVVGRVEDATRRIEAGDIVVVDGDHGAGADPPERGHPAGGRRDASPRARARRAYYETLRDLPAVTRDGVRDQAAAQCRAAASTCRSSTTTGAEGVGLFRTEIPLLMRDAFPDVAEQTGFYRRAYEQAGERPIVFRTLDIGGDKVLPYLADTAEDNPAMGWRAIRIGLDRPAMLRQQLRALLRAAAGRDLRVMFPMIAEVAELEAARARCSISSWRRAGAGGRTRRRARSRSA